MLECASRPFCEAVDMFDNTLFIVDTDSAWGHQITQKKMCKTFSYQHRQQTVSIVNIYACFGCLAQINRFGTVIATVKNGKQHPTQFSIIILLNPIKITPRFTNCKITTSKQKRWTTNRWPLVSVNKCAEWQSKRNFFAHHDRRQNFFRWEQFFHCEHFFHSLGAWIFDNIQ